MRVFQRFSTLNAASGGRAEVILGRGWFTEPFSLFGYELSDYDSLFEEKLTLFAAFSPVVTFAPTANGLYSETITLHSLGSNPGDFVDALPQLHWRGQSNTR